MKRKIFVILLMVFTAFSSLFAVENLGTPSCIGRDFTHGFGDKPFCDTLMWVECYYNIGEKLVIQKETVATVYCEEKEFVTGSFQIMGTYSDILIIDFDSILLPKGKSYRLHVPAGVVALESDASIANDAFNIDFEVPAYLPTTTHSIQEGDIIVSKSKDIKFIFRTEIKSADGTAWGSSKRAEMILCREGIALRKIEGEVAIHGDGGKGYVTAMLDKTIHFEKGVNYSFVLPEGSVCALYRDDLVNKEERMNFVGGSDKSFPELKHSWCNLDGVKTIGALNEVQWIYNSKVALSLAPSIELRNEAGELLKSVVPTLTENEGKWILSADFEGYTINPAETYHLILPESTVVTPSGDVVVNKRSTIRIVKGETGIDDVTDASVTITCANNLLRIEGTTPGDHIALYTVAGSAIATLQADGNTVTLDLSQPGIYVVVVNGKAHKVVNR